MNFERFRPMRRMWPTGGRLPGQRAFYAEGRLPCIWPEIPPRKYRHRTLRTFGYVPRATERKAGRRLYYMLQRRPGDTPKTISKGEAYKTWLRKSGKAGVSVYPAFAYSADHARERISKQEVVPFTSKIVRKPLPGHRQMALLGDLSGDISTCAYWIPTEDGDYACGGYAPTFQSQEAGECKIPPPDQYKFCSSTQMVKSDPKGRYGGKLIRRCKTYRSRCMPEAQCIEDRQFPKPETFKIPKREIQSVAAAMARDFNSLQKESGPALSREVLDRGGVKAYRGAVESEEWAEIPLHLKRKSGMTLDEMASEMGFQDETAFREAINREYGKARKKVRRKTSKDFVKEAESFLIAQEIGQGPEVYEDDMSDVPF